MCTNESPAVLRRVDNVIKSAEDKRSYRALELSNKMKVLLVSDSTTDRSAAALDVNVGEFTYITYNFCITLFLFFRLFK